MTKAAKAEIKLALQKDCSYFSVNKDSYSHSTTKTVWFTILNHCTLYSLVKIDLLSTKDEDFWVKYWGLKDLI